MGELYRARHEGDKRDSVPLASSSLLPFPSGMEHGLCCSGHDPRSPSSLPLISLPLTPYVCKGRDE